MRILPTTLVAILLSAGCGGETVTNDAYAGDWTEGGVDTSAEIVLVAGPDGVYGSGIDWGINQHREFEVSTVDFSHLKQTYSDTGESRLLRIVPLVANCPGNLTRPQYPPPLTLLSMNLVKDDCVGPHTVCVYYSLVRKSPVAFVCRPEP